MNTSRRKLPSVKNPNSLSGLTGAHYIFTPDLFLNKKIQHGMASPSTFELELEDTWEKSHFLSFSFSLLQCKRESKMERNSRLGVGWKIKTETNYIPFIIGNQAHANKCKLSSIYSQPKSPQRGTGDEQICFQGEKFTFPSWWPLKSRVLDWLHAF